MTRHRLLASILATSIAPCLTLAQDFSSPRLDAVTSWIGNTYGGAQKWVQQDISALTVMADGTVFTNVGWDEAGGNAGEYRDGELIRYAGHTHGWGNQGGEAVAANSRYLYVGVAMENEHGGLKDPATWPPKGSKWVGISRRPRADISKAAPFPGGKGGKGDTLKDCLLVVSEVPDSTKGGLPGICASETRVYVADPFVNEIKGYDAEGMILVSHWRVERAGPLALGADGTIWMLQRKAGAEPARLVRYNADGTEVTPALPLDARVEANAFCLLPDGKIAVADDSPAQQIHLYEIRDGALAESGTFGAPSGILNGTPGAFGDRKLNHVTALGADAKSNLYVAHDAQSGGGGTVLESYQLASGKLNWRLLGLTFVDMADIDAASDTDVFTKEEHFRLDYTQPAGREWSYAGYTIDRFKYPEDPRLRIWSGGAWVRQIGGKRVLFVNDMNGDRLQIYRFAPGSETAIPSGLISKTHFKDKDKDKDKTDWPPHQPEKGEWIWRDGNGNGAFDDGEFITNGGADCPSAQGWWVDRAGGIWLATESKGIRYFPSPGFDATGNPQWDYAKMQLFPQPAGLKQIKRLRYDAATDVLYLGGITATDKNQHWKPMGPVLVRFDGWLHGERKLRWQITLPYARGAAGHESCEPMGFDVAGDFVFVPYTGSSKKDNVKLGRVEVFRTSDGSAAGHMEPGAEVGDVGLQDLRETLTAHRRADGEYVVLLEDDAKSKVVMYRVKNLK